MERTRDDAGRTSRRPAAGARDAPASTFDPRELLRVVSARLWLVVAVTVAVVVAVGLSTYTATPYYRAKIRLLLDRDSARVVSFQDIYSLGVEGRDYRVTEYRILGGRAVAAAALRSLPPADRRWFAAQGDAIRTFMDLLRIIPVAKSRLVDVQAEHPDPAAAGRMADAVVAAYIADVQSRRNSASQSALSKLQADAASLHEKLIAAQELTKAFKKRNNLISMNDRQGLVAARLEKLTEELADVERERRAAESRVRTCEKAVQDASFREDTPEVLKSPVVAHFKNELLEARQELSLLSQNYKEKHPRMLALARRIAEVEAQLENEIRAVYRGQKHELEELKLHEASVRKRQTEQTHNLLDVESKTMEYEILEDEVENTRRLYDTILGRLKEVQVIADHETSNVYRVGEVETSEGPVRPRKLRNVLLALLAGFVLACVLAFWVDACDRSIKSPADAAAALSLPILGVVPRLKGKRERRGSLDPETLDHRSSVSEAFRTIRTALAFSGLSKGMRSLVVTSASPDEGKSMVAINLAVSMARQGKRVLLVDADMRRARLHRAFSVTAEEGLSSVLVGARKPSETVVATEVENLFLLPCGVVPPNPVELLGNGLTKALLEEVLADFDLVIFDSPPVSVVSDACVIGTIADRVVFVVRSMATDRALCRRAVAQLHTVGARVTGVILNSVDSKADRYGRQGGYYYSYTYAADEADGGSGTGE